MREILLLFPLQVGGIDKPDIVMTLQHIPGSQQFPYDWAIVEAHVGKHYVTDDAQNFLIDLIGYDLINQKLLEALES